MKIDGKIIAHRGVFNNKDIPENSLKAFNKALRFNYPIELDIQLSKDNALVVFHDFRIDRMTKQKGYIQDMLFSEIENLKLLDTNEKIPRLEDVLELVKGKVLLDIEIKNTKRIKKTCQELINLLNKYNYKNFIIKSFNPLIVKYLKDNYKNLEVGLLINDKYNNFFYNRLLKSNFIRKFCNCDFVAIHKELLKNKKFISKLDSDILVYTIKTRDELIKENNVINICNNLPY